MNNPTNQPDSQAGDELDTLLELLIDEATMYEPGVDIDHDAIPKAKAAISTYAERLGTVARIDELTKRRETLRTTSVVITAAGGGDSTTNGVISTIIRQIDKRIATLTKEAKQ